MIRKFKDKDIDRIMQIWIKSSIDGHRFIKESYWKANYNLVKDTYIPVSETFVYEEDTKIKGFISLIDGNYIGALFVDVDYQGNGIGKKLIKYLMDRYENLSLSVYKQNEKAVNFYKNIGFKIIKEEENEDSGFMEYLMNFEK